MEKSLSSSPRNSASSSDSVGFSCWGCLKLKLPWAKRHGAYRPVGGFRYDPLSYAQNFDDGCIDDNEETTRRGFSARYAAPAAKSYG